MNTHGTAYLNGFRMFPYNATYIQRPNRLCFVFFIFCPGYGMIFRRCAVRPCSRLSEGRPASHAGLYRTYDRRRSRYQRAERGLYNTPVYADKAYIGEVSESLLAEQNSPLNTPIKKKKGRRPDMTEELQSTAISQPIESLVSWIEEKTGNRPTASKVRSTQGAFCSRLRETGRSNADADTGFQLLIRI